jgi:dipeptidase E
MLRLDDNKLSLIGAHPARIFIKGKEPFEVEPGDDVSFLMG